MPGPQLISRAVDAPGAYSRAFYIIAGITLVSSIIPLIVRPPKREIGSCRSGGASIAAEPAATFVIIAY